MKNEFYLPYSLSITVMKRVLATHTHYTGEELLQQLDEGKSGGASSGGGASAHVKVDWDGPLELQGYGIIVYFVMGAPDSKLSFYTKGRDTKRFSAEEQQKHGMRTAKTLRSRRLAQYANDPQNRARTVRPNFQDSEFRGPEFSVAIRSFGLQQ